MWLTQKSREATGTRREAGEERAPSGKWKLYTKRAVSDQRYRIKDERKDASKTLQRTSTIYINVNHRALCTACGPFPMA